MKHSQHSRQTSQSTQSSSHVIVSQLSHLQAIEETQQDNGSFDDENYYGKLEGTFIIAIRQQLQESHLIQSLIKHHIPVVLMEDLDLHGIGYHLPIIADYYDNQDNYYNEEILSFQTLLNRRSNTMKKSNISNRSSDGQRERKRKRSKSITEPPRKCQGERFLSIYNIDSIQEGQTDESNICALEQLRQEFSGKIYYKIENINLNDLLYHSLTNDNPYFFTVIMLCQELLFQKSINFVQKIFGVYFALKERFDLKIRVISYIELWLEYRLIDLIEDESNLCTFLNYYINLAILINYSKNANVTEYLKLLLKSVQVLKDKKKKGFLQSSQKIQRRMSQQIVKKQKKHRQHLSLQFDNQKIKIQHFLNQNFDDWHFYLEIPLIILQRQLWIIDLELYSSISLIEENHQNIADQFDYLLFHMICSTIHCPIQHLPALFSKFIELYPLSLQAQHYQLTHILYTYFNHPIIQQKLQPNEHVNIYNQRTLKIIQNSDSHKLLQPIDILSKQTIIPSMSHIQYMLYRLKLQRIYENDLVIFQVLQGISQHLFPIAQLQVMERKYQQKYIVFKQEPYYQYLSQDLRISLQSYLKCDKKQIEIQLFKIHNQINN